MQLCIPCIPACLQLNACCYTVVIFRAAPIPNFTNTSSTKLHALLMYSQVPTNTWLQSIVANLAF